MYNDATVRVKACSNFQYAFLLEKCSVTQNKKKSIPDVWTAISYPIAYSFANNR